jgi:hypothetical protein
MKEHLKEAFARGFQEECEKIAVLPVIGAALGAGAKAVGTGLAMEGGTQLAKKAFGAGKKKSEGVPTV